MNNLKQIGLAFHNHNSQYGHFPASVNLGGRNKTIPYSWRVAILPFIDHQALYDAYNFDEPWDGPNNRKLIDKMPAIYGYPADGTSSSRGNSSYFVFTGRSTALSGASEPTGAAGGRPAAVAPGPVAAPTGPDIAQITDGTSYTILAVEARRDIPWTKPEDIPFNLNAPLPDLGGFTPDGFNALLADGSVRYLKKSIAMNLLKALITRDGGEVISEW